MTGQGTELAQVMRREVATRVARAYAELDGVAAVGLTGSVSRGHADRFSDVELMVVWDAEPSEEARAGVVSSLAEDFRILVDEDELFVGRSSSGSPNTGMLVEVVHARRAEVDSVFRAVLEEGDPDLQRQALVHALGWARPVAGEAAFAGWAARAQPYPDVLRRNAVKTFAQVDNFWRQQMWEARANPLMKRDQAIGVQKQMLVVLQAVNRRYHFGFKWIDRLIDELALAPPGLRDLIRSTEPDGVRALVEAVFDLVEAHVDDVNVSRLREIFRWQRTPWPAT